MTVTKRPEAVDYRELPAARTETEPRVKTTADVLRHAARIIEERGWYQGGYQEGGQLCALGALNVATTGDYLINSGAAVDAAVCLIKAIDGYSVLDWNDTPGRTATEVLAALRAAADEAER